MVWEEEGSQKSFSQTPKTNEQTTTKDAKKKENPDFPFYSIKRFVPKPFLDFSL